MKIYRKQSTINNQNVKNKSNCFISIPFFYIRKFSSDKLVTNVYYECTSFCKTAYCVGKKGTCLR